MASPQPKTSRENYGVPTILVMHQLRVTFIDALRHEGYFVLEAFNQDEALSIIRMHSRPIHVLVKGVSTEWPTLAALLRAYRPRTEVVSVSENHQESDLPDFLKGIQQALDKTVKRTENGAATGC